MTDTALQVSDTLDCLPPAAARTGRLQERVLLIEDSEDSMLLVRHALQQYGQGRYGLVWKASLSDGLSELSSRGADVVLLDLGLPESSGPESYAWVREIASDIPVVVLTGDDCAETELPVLASGVQDYLIKGQISGSEIVQTIRVALSANRKQQHQPIDSNKLIQRLRWTSNS